MRIKVVHIKPYQKIQKSYERLKYSKTSFDSPWHKKNRRKPEKTFLYYEYKNNYIYNKYICQKRKSNFKEKSYTLVYLENGDLISDYIIDSNSNFLLLSPDLIKLIHLGNKKRRKVKQMKEVMRERKRKNSKLN